MSERTVLFLVGLSHHWLPLVLPLPVVFGVTTHILGTMWARTQHEASALVRRSYIALRGFSCALLIISCGVCGIAFLHIGCAALVAHSAQCMSNVKQLSLGALMYAQDYDERLPASTRWAESIASRVKESASSSDVANSDPFRCPAAESPASYGMNAFLSGVFFE